ncbi:MAG: hypothetical protein QOE03_2711 [Micromonosporaceae bacterium]|nr:hypothetical protein [Micromonosporaceae bacterium]
MLGVLPRMAGEAPPGYVAFVRRHLDRLRRDAAGVVGDDGDPDQLYPDVLEDIAVRWRWLELAGTRLGRAGVADRYLRTAFSRRAQRWQARWEPEQPTGALTVTDIRVLPPSAPPSSVGGARPARSSGALRQAAYLRPQSRTEVGPLAEAAIAWWHAYETHRRRLLITGLVAVSVVVLAGIGPLQTLVGGGAAP